MSFVTGRIPGILPRPPRLEPPRCEKGAGGEVLRFLERFLSAEAGSLEGP